MSKEMARLAGELPAYVWLVALPQLISRATHCHARTSEATRKIITSVFGHYPDQVSSLHCFCLSKDPSAKTGALKQSNSSREAISTVDSSARN